MIKDILCTWIIIIFLVWGYFFGQEVNKRCPEQMHLSTLSSTVFGPLTLAIYIANGGDEMFKNNCETE